MKHAGTGISRRSGRAAHRGEHPWCFSDRACRLVSEFLALMVLSATLAIFLGPVL